MDADLRAQKLMQARKNSLNADAAWQKEETEQNPRIRYSQMVMIRSLLVLFVLVLGGFWGTTDAVKYEACKEWLADELVAFLGL